MKIKNIAIPTAVLLFVIISAIAVFFNFSYKDKLLPNITINGESYSGLTKQEIIEKLENKIKSAQDGGLVFVYNGREYKADESQLPISVDVEKIVSEAFDYGHEKGILKNFIDYITLLNKNIDFLIQPQIKEADLENYISKEMSKLEDKPRDFGYEYKKYGFAPISAKSGIVIDRDKMKKDIFRNFSNFRNDKIEIELLKKNPEVTEDLEESALIQANNLLSKKIVLKYNLSVWKVPREDFVSWIGFEPSYASGYMDKKVLGIKAKKEKINDYLLSIVPQINRSPTNAQLEFKNGKVSLFSLSQEGISLQIEKSVEEINNTVFAAENYKSDSPEQIEVAVVIEKVQPEITTQSIDNMGITSLLATGESNFYGSPNNRKHNIAVGASKFNGVLIGPGDEFSFNKALGEVGPKEGYLPELVIKKGETVPEYGGGLCQVSTTTFRAAVNAGLEITERRNHAYPVKYYNPQGTDATIYPPHPDLRFINNTPAYILIQTRVVGNNLYFDFYGSDDGRKVELKGPYIYDKEPDGSMKANWVQEVYGNEGELLFKKTFNSVYKSPSLYPYKNPLE